MAGLVDYKLNGTVNVGADIDDYYNDLIDALLSSFDIDAGILTFGVTPKCANTPTVDEHLTNKKFVDDSISAIPTFTLNAYDSGWFAVARDTTYVKTHNLNTTNIITKLYFATDVNGTNMLDVDFADFNIGGTINPNRGGQLVAITTTQISASSTDYVAFRYLNGSRTEYSSGYYRIVALALE